MSDGVSASGFGGIPVRRLSVADLQGAAVASDRELVPIYSPGDSNELAEPATRSHDTLSQSTAEAGTQDVLELPDDLIVVRTNFQAIGPSQRQRWELEMQGWFYLHFRLDGHSEEESSDGHRAIYDGECFLLSASQRRPCARRLRGDAWRSVAILCRPQFAIANLRTLNDDLPRGLQRVYAGDPDVDFWHAGMLTSDMRAAVSALLLPRIYGNMRRAYMHAKAVELICLAVEQLRGIQPLPEDMLRLTDRDVSCLKEARKILSNCVSVPSLDQLAKHVGTNRCKLALGFKQVFGLTVGQYHRKRRLELAREMLENNTIAIGHIAAAAGYADAGSFSKAFRAQHGFLPSELRFRMLNSQVDVEKEKLPPDTD